jgi:hypothetical protein
MRAAWVQAIAVRYSFQSDGRHNVLAPFCHPPHLLKSTQGAVAGMTIPRRDSTSRDTSMMTELYWFDRSASKTIDGAIRAVIAEHSAKHPGYSIAEQLDPSPARERCLLVIRNSDLREMSRLTGRLEIGTAGDDKIRVRKSFAWHDFGQPEVIAMLDRDKVTDTVI